MAEHLVVLSLTPEALAALPAASAALREHLLGADDLADASASGWHLTLPAALEAAKPIDPIAVGQLEIQLADAKAELAAADEKLYEAKIIKTPPDLYEMEVRPLIDLGLGTRNSQLVVARIHGIEGLGGGSVADQLDLGRVDHSLCAKNGL